MLLKGKLRYHTVIAILLVLSLLGSGCGIPGEEIKEIDTMSEGIEVRGVPSFTEDGAAMVYMDQETSTLNLYDWQTEESRKFSFPYSIYNPKISPDGKNLFYTQLSEHGYFSELWTLDLDTGVKFRLTSEENGDIYSYAIAPDGSCLVFTAFRDSVNRQTIYLIQLVDPPEICSINGDMPKMTIDDFIQPVFSIDGKEVLFALNKKIHTMDVSSCQLIKTINVKRPVHFLSAFSHYGVFVSIQDGYYQVFSVHLQTGEVKQLTFDRTNKLLPHIAEDGYLYYLDGGETLNLKKLSYMVWLMGRNSTSVFKDYRNDWGRVAWGESHALEFLITSYKAFTDEYFLEEFANHVSSVLGNLDIRLGIKDYSGISTYGWSATRYSLDKTSRMRGLVHDGMIGAPLAEFVKLTRGRAYSDSAMSKLADQSLETLRHLVELHETEWVEHDADTLAITAEGEVYYIFPKGRPSRHDGVNLPFNQQNRFGTLLILLYEIDGESQYLDKALKLGRVFHRHLIPDGDGCKWHYWWGKGATGWSADEGISTNKPSYDGHQGFDARGYATLELEFVTRLAQYGVFDGEDMQRFVNTYLNADSTIHFRNSKAGALLANYSQEIQDKMREIDILSEPWQHIPYLGLVLGEQGDTTWKVKKIEISTKGQPVTQVEEDNLLYFLPVNNGSELAVICKESDQPYNVRILSNAAHEQSGAACLKEFGDWKKLSGASAFKSYHQAEQ